MQPKHIKNVLPFSDLVTGLACTLLMIQAYLIAPLSLALQKEFGSALVELAIPAFIIPFALTAGGMFFLKAMIKLRTWFLFSLAALYLGTYMLSISTSVMSFLIIRVLTGFGTGIMLPSALLLKIRANEEKQYFNYMLFIIFALAAGMTFGPSLGGWLNGLIGWRCLYRLIGMLAASLFFIYFWNTDREETGVFIAAETRREALSSLDSKRKYVYSFVFLTGVVHSGVFVWISHYFSRQYGVDEFRFATELFIFGLPGFLVALLMHYFQLGKQVIVVLYSALSLTAAGLLLLLGNLPLPLAEIVLFIMSVGFACSQPLFIGISELPATSLGQVKIVARGSGLLFAGYGSGPLIMVSLLSVDIRSAFMGLMVMMLTLACISLKIWSLKGKQAASI